MVKLTNVISRLKRRKILLAGDLMLDTYTVGKVRRISPEAPVAVVQVASEESRPGGAGNAALNMISLGADVVLLGRIGQDPAGVTLREALEQEGIDVRGVFIQNEFKTPLKNRIIADNQQVVRVDYEQVTPLSEMLEQHIIDSLPKLLEGVSAVAISDYGKGMLSRTLLASLIEQAKALGLPIITDPKGVEFGKYSGSTIIKPNLSEAYAAAGLHSDASLDLVAQRVLHLSEASMLMVTRSEAGISVFQRTGERFDFPVKIREIKDVTGAGDTVLAMLTYAIASDLSIHEATQLCNVAAGISVERFGCARVSLSDLARRLLEFDVDNKIFDGEHLFTLQQALRNSSYSLLGLYAKQGMLLPTFSSIQKLSKQSDGNLVIYLLDLDPDQDFVQLLASMQDVKFIIIQSGNLNSLCEEVPPANIYALNGKELVELSSTSALLEFV